MGNERWDKVKSLYAVIKERVTDPKTLKLFRITYSVVWNLLLLFMIFAVLGIAAAAGVGAGYFASLVKDEKIRSYESMKKDIYDYEEPSEVYFAGNEYLGKLRSDVEREEVKIGQVSEYLIKAVIATEDENFMEHNGVVPKAVMRALFQEVSNSAVQSGGSTLTQQLIKNQILTNEVSFERKAKEILLALRLEKFFSKEEILEAYLNVAPFGRNSSGKNIAGVQAAAKGIFGVDAKDLNLPQAAYIAGLPQSPFRYTPFTKEGKLKEQKYLQYGLNRYKTVLKRMYETKAISKKEYEEALKYDIVKDFIPPQKSPLEKYPYLTMEVERRAVEILMKKLYTEDGYTDEDIENSEVLYRQYQSLAYKNLRQNGYKIYTTIDKEIYDKWQQVVKNFNGYGPDLRETVDDPETGERKTVAEPMEVGAVLIENNTGKILSFVGGRDYKRENLNHATQAYRQNGSTMKPLLVYGPAIDMGIASPGSVLADVPLAIPTGSGVYRPSNFTKNRYYGLVPAREALKHSYNVSAVYLYQKVLPKNPVEHYLEKMKFSKLTPSDYSNLSMALGALGYGVSVEENTNAFSTFANGGKFVDAYIIEKIVDGEGKVIYEHKSEPVEVYSPQASYLTIDMMRDVVRGGTARALPSYLKFSADWAGKTGTSQETRDIWFVGLNPNVTAGIWMGYDTPKTIPGSYRSVHLRLWAQLMNAAYDADPDFIAPKERFRMPGGIVKRTYCAVSGLLPSAACAKAGLTASDYYIAEYAPTKTDDNLILGKYVAIGGKNYLALDSTPREFVQEGWILRPEFVKEMAPNLKDPRQLLPNTGRWSKILIPEPGLEENGKIPSPVNITMSGQTIRWKAHPEKDIVGYRVYLVNNGEKVRVLASIRAGEQLAFPVRGSGQFAVTAVDIAGKESPLSNIVAAGSFRNESGPGNQGDPPGSSPVVPGEPPPSSGE